MTLVKLCIKSLLIFAIFNACQAATNIPKNYPRMIGDISYDEAIDTSEFNLCNDEKFAVQYYTFTKIIGEKPYPNENMNCKKYLSRIITQKELKQESGLLRIRFLVNCEGESGRFRIIGMGKIIRKRNLMFL